ncbi:MAG: alkyl hydroperoxide reductase/Thiol specific antioxidant/Mal allergen [Bacteroidetes bacterium]|nr:alkyl hydroperoxide reductase/Thiol specific antioxidant/Mal allergen [Bacteroidota bacterium]
MFFAAALIALFLDQEIIASCIAVTGLVVLMINPHKSGNVFIVAFFIGAITLGTAADYPFVKFPATLVFLLLIGIVFNVRTWFFEKLFIYKILWFESVTTLVLVFSFGVTAYFINYDLRQWLTASPIFLFGIFSFIIYKDRNDARLMVKEKNLETTIGKSAPDFTLPDQNGNPVNMKELLAKHHLLLIFVRGDWCPTCHMMLRSYFKNKEKFAEKNVRIVGIGPDPQGVNKEIMSRIDENSLLLCDDEQATALLYTSAVQENNPISKQVIKNGVPLPASFLVHQDGIIAFTSRSDKAGEILQPELIFDVLKNFK